jgi:hypothetical protein
MTLPADVTRCRPAGVCAVKETCLRYTSPVPDMGSVSDFLLTRTAPLWLDCNARIPVSDAEKYQPAPATPKARPWPGDA